MADDDLRNRVIKTGMTFMSAELDFALNLLDSAHCALTYRHRETCIADAGKAYLAVLQLLPRIRLDSENRAEINRRLIAIQTLYHRLGVLPPANENPRGKPPVR